MKAKKKVLTDLTLCYAVGKLHYQGVDHFMVSAEKVDKCYLFNLEGEIEATLWDGPGGVMTIEQVPGSDGVFLTTQKFYSPNNSAEASLVVCAPDENGVFGTRKMMNFPFLHRFCILERNGVRYIAAGTLKSHHGYKDDWTCPGRIWVGELPEDLDSVTVDNPIEFTPLVSGLYRNHGFCKTTVDGVQCACFGSDQGVHMVMPPAERGGEWTVTQLLDRPTSDVLMIDIDGDGEDEMLTLAPFHGETVTIFKKKDGVFKTIYTYPYPMPFLHAIWNGEVGGKNVAFIGNRREKMQLLAIYCDDPEKMSIKVDVLDEGAGPANCMTYKYKGKDWLVAANRETNEVALYELVEE